MTSHGALCSIAVLMVMPAMTLSAQQPSIARDSLHLGDLQNAAVQTDPRARQIGLLASQSALRQQDIDVTRLPSLDANALGQYQSEVVTIPLRLPNGLSIPVPSHDVYDAHVAAQQSLYDPGVSAKRGVERAQLAASQAGVRSSLFALRQSVNDAYFTVLMQQAQRAEQEAVIADLEAQHAVAASRVKQGTALPSEAEMLEAEVLRRRQAVAELDAGRSAELVVLSDLTGRTITSADALALPDLSAEVVRARTAFDTLRARPEYEQFDRSRDVLVQQQASLKSADLPKVLELAKRPNAVIKVSGACTLSHQPFPFPDIWDPLARVFDAWGLERCLWGTDWTRAYAVVNFEQAVEPFLKTDRLTASERAMLMGGACAKAYGWSPRKK